MTKDIPNLDLAKMILRCLDRILDNTKSNCEFISQKLLDRMNELKLILSNKVKEIENYE